MIKTGTIRGKSYHITCTRAVYEHRTLKVVSSECYDNGRSSSSLIFHTFLIFIFMNIDENCKLNKKKKIKNRIKKREYLQNDLHLSNQTPKVLKLVSNDSLSKIV